MSDHDEYPNDPGISLTSRSRRVALALLVIGILALLILALTDRTEAAPAQDAAPACPTATPRPTVTPTPTPGPTGIGLSSFTAYAAGNKGGCGYKNRNMRYGVTCNVDDAGPGFVSGACEDGYWFSRVKTYRTFTIGQIVTVNGCEGLNLELYAPIRISK